MIFVNSTNLQRNFGNLMMAVSPQFKVASGSGLGLELELELGLELRLGFEFDFEFPKFSCLSCRRTDESLGVHTYCQSKTSYLGNYVGTSVLLCLTCLLGVNIRFRLQLYVVLFEDNTKFMSSKKS